MKSSAISHSQRQALYSFGAEIISKISALGCALWRDKKAQLAIACIFGINILFIAAHCAVQIGRHLGARSDLFLIQHFDLFRIDRDGSYAEWFIYVQTAVCVALLLGVFRRTRQPLYIAWALTFLFVVLDDSLMIHERVSIYLVNTFDIPVLPGLRPHESGELLTWAMAGSVLFGVLWWGFARSRPGARAAGGVLALTFCALVFFAIGVDMLHVALSHPGAALYGMLAILEDGGEMLSIGLTCAVALLLYRHPALAGEMAVRPGPSPKTIGLGQSAAE